MKTEKIHIKQAIVVEGRYDASKISNISDAMVITTDGFSIFSDESKQKLLKKIAAQRGLVILTDSDSAGFKIRYFITGLVGKEKVINVYIPDIEGKEKRKAAPSKEGLLGVEGVSDAVIIELLKNLDTSNNLKSCEKNNGYTAYDLFTWKMSGVPGAAERKRKFLKLLELPERLNKNNLLQVINSAFDKQEIVCALEKINTEVL